MDDLSVSVTYEKFNVEGINTIDIQEFKDKVASDDLDTGTWKVTYTYSNVSHILCVVVDASSESPNYAFVIKNTLKDVVNEMDYGTKSDALNVEVKEGESVISKDLLHLFYLKLDENESFDENKKVSEYAENSKLESIYDVCGLNAGMYKICARVSEHGNYAVTYTDFIDFEVKKAKLELYDKDTEIIFTYCLSTSSEKTYDLSVADFENMNNNGTFNKPSEIKFIACSDGIDINNDDDANNKLTIEFVIDYGEWSIVDTGKKYNAGLHDIKAQFAYVQDTENFEIADNIDAKLEFLECEIGLPYVQLQEEGDNVSVYKEPFKLSGNFITVTSSTVGALDDPYHFVYDSELIEMEKTANEITFNTKTVCADGDPDFKITLVPEQNYKFIESSSYYEAFGAHYYDLKIINGVVEFKWRVTKSYLWDIYGLSYYKQGNNSYYYGEMIRDANTNDGNYSILHNDNKVYIQFGLGEDKRIFDDLDIEVSASDSSYLSIVQDENDRLKYIITIVDKEAWELNGKDIILKLTIKLKQDELVSKYATLTDNDVALEGFYILHTCEENEYNQ